MMMDEQNNRINKSKLVTACTTQGRGLALALGDFYKPFVYKGGSQSEMTKVVVEIPPFPKNLMYYEHYKTSGCKSSNRLSFILVGGSDNGQVDHDFTEYDLVSSVDFSHQLGSVAAAFHIVSQLANCAAVRFYLDDTNIELSSTSKEPNKTFSSKSVRHLEIHANDVKEEKWEERETRVDEILKYAQTHSPNLVRIKFVCPLVAIRNRYVQVIEEFLELAKRRGSGFLPHHRTTIEEGVVRCYSVDRKGDPKQVVNGRRSTPISIVPQQGHHHHHATSTGVIGLNPAQYSSTLPPPPMVQPNPFQYPHPASHQQYIEKEFSFRGGSSALEASSSSTPFSATFHPVPIPLKRSLHSSPQNQVGTIPPKRMQERNNEHKRVAEQISSKVPPSNQTRPLARSYLPSSSQGARARHYTPQPSSTQWLPPEPPQPQLCSSLNLLSDSAYWNALNNVHFNVEEIRNIISGVNANQGKIHQQAGNKRHNSSKSFKEGVDYDRRRKY